MWFVGRVWGCCVRDLKNSLKQMVTSVHMGKFQWKMHFWGSERWSYGQVQLFIIFLFYFFRLPYWVALDKFDCNTFHFKELKLKGKDFRCNDSARE